jgi:glutamine amidotransferase-like uncharacterized protein
MTRRPLIGLLVEGMATTSIRLSLRRSFPGHNLRELAALDLKNVNLMRELDMLVLPGVPTEHSFYPAYYDENAVKALHAGLDNGLWVESICAAAYHMSARKSYDSPTKKVVGAPGLGLLDGEMQGPVDGRHPIIHSRNRFSDTRVISIAFNDEAGKEATLDVCYANGGVYIGKDVDVVARYRGIAEDGVAIGRKAVRNGCIQFRCVLPETTLSEIPAVARNHPFFESYMRLREALIPHEDTRHTLEEGLARPFRAWFESGRAFIKKNALRHST